MKILLSKVEDIFELQNIGCVVAPGIPAELSSKSTIKVGDELELRFPNGITKTTKIAGLTMLCRTPEKPPIPITLPKEIKKKDIPIGTELWVEHDKVR